MTRASGAAVVLPLTAASLAYEVLLVRIFSIEQFHHFASMAVGVAMLGIGAAGTLVAVAPAPWRQRISERFASLAVLAALALIVTPLAAAQIRLDPTALAWDFGQWGRLSVLYVALAIPFGMVSLATLAALAEVPTRPGTVYGASLAGAGLGAAAALGSLWLFTPVRALAIPGVLGAIAAMTAMMTGTRRGPVVRGLAIGASLLAAVFLARPPWKLHLLPYKGMSQVLGYPGARITTELTNPVGWVVAVEAPAFRYAPGLSLAYRGEFPPQTAIFSDGELIGALSRLDDRTAAALDWQPSALPYALGARRRVLVVGSGGGHEVANALAHGATEVIAVELQPAVVSLAREPYRATDRQGQVRWFTGSAREFAGATRERFSLVTLGLSGGVGGGGGARTLSEDYDHTVDAYAGYLRLLDSSGVLSLTGWLAEPPRENVRAILTAMRALQRVAPARIAAALVVVRSWGSATILVKPDGFSHPEIATLEAWAAGRGFDLDWRPGRTEAETRFNFVDRVTLFEAAQAAVQGETSAGRFADAYPFDVRPATDARPFPHHFVGFRAIRWLLGRPRGDWLAFADWGHIALLATLAQSVLLAAVLMLIPAAARARRPPGVGARRLVAYFGAIGIAYLAAEIAAIQQLTLLLGHPVYAVAAVLTGLLMLSGIGSALSDRVSPTASPVILGLLVGGCVGCAVGLLPVIHLVQSMPLVSRTVLALVALAPIGVLMGLPFPLGLRALAGPEPARLAWAWAANGFASVVAAPLAALVALEVGTPAVFLVAAAGYGFAGGMVLGSRG